MSGKDALSYIGRICRGLDDGSIQNCLKKVIVATAVPATVLVAGYSCAAYGAPWVSGGGNGVEDCNDGYDNNYDGLADCDDPDCSALELCLGCHDGHDNDGNGQADCSDPDCASTEGCTGTCDDGVDNDGDVLTDCADPNCAGLADCT